MSGEWCGGYRSGGWCEGYRSVCVVVEVTGVAEVKWTRLSSVSYLVSIQSTRFNRFQLELFLHLDHVRI